jgi:carboxypeptidase C (cathepsin A)
MVDNFYFVTVYKAGHLVPHDAPESAYDMIKRFINREKDWTN